MGNIKDWEGAVDVNGDITPITRQKIEQVTPNQWSEMSINELWDQRIVLSNRMVMANQSGSYEIAKQIQNGVNQLDALLQHKASATEEASTKTGLL